MTYRIGDSRIFFFDEPLTFQNPSFAQMGLASFTQMGLASFAQMGIAIV